MKIGLLIPRSSLYPSVGFDLLDGLSVSLKHHGLSGAQIVTESIGFGEQEKVVYASAEKLLMDHQCDVIAGYLSPFLNKSLLPLMESANRLLLSLESGYSFYENENPMSHLHRITLNGYLCALDMVAHAASQPGSTAAQVFSYYDSGYRMPYAFAQALQRSGAETVHVSATPLRTADFTIQPLTASLRQQFPDVIMASFCEEMAIQFFEAAAQEEVYQHVKIKASPLMLEESYLAGKVNWTGWPVSGSVPWARGLTNPANLAAMEAMRKSKDKEMNVFSLLGWEAGQVIATGLREPMPGTRAASALDGFTFQSPRGTVVLDGETRFSIAPVYEAETQAADNGKTALRIIGESAGWRNQVPFWLEDMRALGESGTSWKNLYTCV